MRSDAEFQCRVLRVFEDMLDQPAERRWDWLEGASGVEPAVREAVHAMAEAAAASRSLPTLPPEPRGVGDDDAAPERIGHYRVIDTLGSGGMGVVYLGERDDGLFEHKAAIKVMRRTLFSEQALARFTSERRILARLRHPHIAQMLDGGVQGDGGPFIVMELIGGRPITEYCDEHRLGLSGRLDLFAQAADAIEYAHRNLIVHADIKPNNVVVEDGFGVKLLDFGVARLLDEGEEGRHEGYTSGYASPARMEGMPATPADDVYAAGVLLGELVEGQVGVDGDLRSVIAKATAADAALRYGAMSELLEDIKAWRAHRPVGAAAASRAHRTRLFWRRHRVALSLSASAGLTLLVALGTISALYVQSEHRRALAEQRYTASLHMADYIIGSADPALARAPGTLATRKELVAQTGAYLRNLETSRSPSPALMREIAAGYLRMAKIDGLDPSGGIGDVKAAQTSLDHADSLIAQAAQQEPDAPDLMWLRGEARLLDGTRIFIEPSEKGAHESLKALAEARSYFTRYLKLRPHDTEAQLALWTADVFPARDDYYLNRNADGRAAIERHLANPDVPVHTLTQRQEREFILNASYLLLGESYENSDPQKTILLSSILINRINKLQQQGASDWENNVTQVSGITDRARSETALKQNESAIDDYTNGIKLMNRLYIVGQIPSIGHWLAYTRANFANLLASSNKITEARRISNDSIIYLRQYVAQDPEDTSRKRLMAMALTNRAELEADHGAPETACGFTREAAATWRALEQDHAATERDLSPGGWVSKLSRLHAPGCSAVGLHA